MLKEQSIYEKGIILLVIFKNISYSTVLDNCNIQHANPPTLWNTVVPVEENPKRNLIITVIMTIVICLA